MFSSVLSFQCKTLYYKSDTEGKAGQVTRCDNGFGQDVTMVFDKMYQMMCGGEVREDVRGGERKKEKEEGRGGERRKEERENGGMKRMSPSELRVETFVGTA